MEKRRAEMEKERAETEKERAEENARENLYRGMAWEAVSLLSSSQVSAGLFKGVEALSVMRDEQMKGYQPALQAFRESLRAVGGVWLYEADDAEPFTVREGGGTVTPSVTFSEDDNSVVFRLRPDVLIVVTGLLNSTRTHSVISLPEACQSCQTDRHLVVSKDGSTVFLVSGCQNDSLACPVLCGASVAAGSTTTASVLFVDPVPSILLVDDMVFAYVCPRGAAGGVCHISVWNSPRDLLSGSLPRPFNPPEDLTIVSNLGDISALHRCRDEATGTNIAVALHEKQDGIYATLFKPSTASSDDWPFAGPVQLPPSFSGGYGTAMGTSIVIDSSCGWLVRKQSATEVRSEGSPSPTFYLNGAQLFQNSSAVGGESMALLNTKTIGGDVCWGAIQSVSSSGSALVVCGEDVLLMYAMSAPSHPSLLSNV